MPNHMPNAGDFLTRSEAASLLRVTTETLLQWEKDGKGPVPTRLSPRKALYLRSELAAYIGAHRADTRPALGSVAITMSPAVRTLVEAERRRIRTILARAPKGFEAAAWKAINTGASLEAFDASLPGELQAVMPALHRFIADFDRPTDGGDAAADSIITTARALRGN